MKTRHPDTTSPATKKTGALVAGGIVVLICCVAAGILLFQAWSSSHEKQHISALLDTRATALTQKNLSQYMSCFSTQYRSGEKTYEDLFADASRWFSQFTTIQFSSTVLTLEIQGDTALVKNTYSFSLTNTEGKPIHLTQQELLELRRESDGWKIMSSLSPQ